MKKKFLAVVSGITLLIFGSLVATPANAGSESLVWVSWHIPSGTVHGTPHNASDVGWPQRLVGVGQLTPPCGEWYQVDLYPASHYQFGEYLEMVNGQPEDSRYVRDWYFIYGGDCAPDPEITHEESATSECTVPLDGTATVTYTHTVTTVSFRLVDGEWVRNDPVTVTNVATELVDDAGCKPEVTEPPVTPPTPTPEAPKPHPVHHEPNFTG